jgi:prevent-host-death family protein
MNAETPVDRTVTIHEAKTHLSRLIARAEAGEEIVVARGNKPVAKIVPLSPPASAKKPRVPGRLAHLVPPGTDVLGDGFWDPLSDEEMGLGDKEGVLERWAKSFSSTRTP